MYCVVVRFVLHVCVSFDPVVPVFVVYLPDGNVYVHRVDDCKCK